MFIIKLLTIMSPGQALAQQQGPLFPPLQIQHFYKPSKLLSCFTLQRFLYKITIWHLLCLIEIMTTILQGGGE